MLPKLSDCRAKFRYATFPIVFLCLIVSGQTVEARQKNYLDTTWWDSCVTNITDSNTYLRRKFRQDVTDRSTGVDSVMLANILEKI